MICSPHFQFFLLEAHEMHGRMRMNVMHIEDNHYLDG